MKIYYWFTNCDNGDDFVVCAINFAVACKIAEKICKNYEVEAAISRDFSKTLGCPIY